MGTHTQNKPQKSSLFRSIKSRISLLLTACIIGVVVILLALILPNVKATIKKLTQNYLYDVTISAGEKITLGLSENDAETILNTETLGQLVGDIALEGVTSSYAYVVNPDGIMHITQQQKKSASPSKMQLYPMLLKTFSQAKRTLSQK